MVEFNTNTIQKHQVDPEEPSGFKSPGETNKYLIISFFGKLNGLIRGMFNRI